MSYIEKQEAWVKEYNVEVGVKARVRDTWAVSSNGYQFAMVKNRLGWLCRIREIHDDTLIVYFYDRLPYEDPEYPSGIIKTFEKVPFFVLDIIGKPISTPAGITPFKNKEEFFPHKDRWFEDAESTEFARVTHFNDEGVVLGSGEEADFVYYSELLSKGYKLVDGDIREYPGLDSKGNLKCLI